jgi:acyl-CoA thioester hydrolase
MDRGKFKYKTQVRVRNYEVDWQGIVHNANYLLYFEVGRIEYLKHLGINIDLNAIRNDSKIVLVRNEIDYKSSVQFDDLLDIYTRILYIKNTSFVFEGIIEKAANHSLVAENIAIHVWLNSRTGEPMRVNDEFRSTIKKFEGENFSNLESPLLT